MEKGILEEAVAVVERATVRLKGELSSLFTVGNQMPATERLAKSEHFLAVASVILRLEEEIIALRETAEEVEEKRDIFLCALERRKSSMPPKMAKKWRG